MSLSSAHAEAADLAVQGTNNSSITSKRSAERLGYFEHCHIHGVTSRDSPLLLKHVVPKPARRSPVINRAYFMRTDGIRRITEQWLEGCAALAIPECAIISLGCGFDPTFFRLQAITNEKAQRGVRSPTHWRYVDIDYPALITEKLYTARTNPELVALLPNDAHIDDVGQLASDTYSCLGVDLRQLDQLASALQQAGVTPEANMPTLIISEVVLAYLTPEESDAVLGFFSRYPRATFVLHEQCVPAFDQQQDRQGHNDSTTNNMHPFAVTMYTHFERTMTSLKTLRQYRSIEDQAARFQRLGWSEGHILNMNLFEDKVVLADPSLRRRIATLEPFDEFDEMHWIGTYYFMGIATTPAMIPTDPMPNVVKALGLSLTLQTLPPSPGCFTSWPSSTPTVESTSTHRDSTSPPLTPTDRAIWTPQAPLGSLEIRRKGHSLCILDDYAYIFGGFGDDYTPSSDGAAGEQGTTLFQPRNNQQGRLSSMVVYNLATGAHRGMDHGPGAGGSSSHNSSLLDWPSARMYHAAVESQDGTSFYMYGGRDGPTKVHNDMWQFSAEEGWTLLWRAKTVTEGGFDSAFPKGLYKHSLTSITLAGRELIVLLGGRNAQGEANDQVWAFDPVDSQWAKFHWRPAVAPRSSSSTSSSPSTSPLASPRATAEVGSSLPSSSSSSWSLSSSTNAKRWQGLFSHSATAVTDRNGLQSLLVYGGIRGKGERVLNLLWRVTLGIDEETYTCWADATPISLHPAEMPKEHHGGDLMMAARLDEGDGRWTPKSRFSHVGVAVANNKVWLLGGVSDPALLQWQETVAEIELMDDGDGDVSATYRELTPSAFKPLVMVNHAAAIDRSRGRVVGVGGGGVCFGFGGWFDSESWGLALPVETV
ncbi:Leucine carboxyl methyltransferase 2 [Actinomortierella ambigua]|nr:Leucine carboxyl methyltransferase 2 [Actinomortierella ambigua]